MRSLLLERGEIRDVCDSPADAEQTREALRLLKCIGAAQGTAKPQPKASQPRVCDGRDRPRSQATSKESQSINRSVFSAVTASLDALSIPKAFLKAHYQTRSVRKVGLRVFESSLLFLFVFSLSRFKTPCDLHMN